MGVKSAPRRKSDKIWRDALIRAVARVKDVGGVEAGLDELADQVVSLAKSGEAAMLKEIGDRLDGKPMQQTHITGDGPDGAIPLIITGVRRKADGGN